MTGCYVYLVPVEGLCEGDCAGTEEWHSAESVLVAMDEKGARQDFPTTVQRVSAVPSRSSIGGNLDDPRQRGTS